MIILELKRYINSLFRRVIFSLLILIIVSFALKNNCFYETIYNMIYYDTLDFSYIYSKYNFLLGNIASRKESYVSSYRLKYKEISQTNNSFELVTDANLVINNINPGVVTFIGEVENLGFTVIISGDNNIDYWYSNLENISVNLYDHINNEILGSTIDDKLIMTFKKDNEYLSYEGLI